MLQEYRSFNSPIGIIESKLNKKFHKISNKLYSSNKGDLIIFDESNITFVPHTENSQGEVLGSKLNESFRIRHFGGGVTTYNTDEILKKRLTAFLKIPYDTQGALNLFILHGPPGMGKCLFNDSPVLTPLGWTTMGKIKLGDDVIGSNGKPTKVVGVYPQENKKQVIKLTFNKNIEVECSPDHLWTVIDAQKTCRGTKSYTKKTITTEKLVEKWTLNAGHGKLKPRFSIERIKPVEFIEKIPENKRVDPYVLGVLLGDGSVIKRNTLHFTSMDDEIVNRVRDAAHVMGCDISMSPIIKSRARDYYFVNKEVQQAYVVNGYHTSVAVNSIKESVANLGLFGHNCYNKFIPKDYLYSSVATRIELLRGLMDTDGTIYVTPKKRNRKEHATTQYCTSSKQLAEDVSELVRSLGGIVSVNEKYPSYTKGDGLRVVPKVRRLHYVININMDINPFSLSRKANLFDKFNSNNKRLKHLRITNVEVTDEFKDAVCIKVDSGDKLYAIKDYILTHNSESVEQFIEEILGKSPSSVLPGLSGVTKKMYEDNIKLRDEYDDLLQDDEQKARKLQWDELSIDEQRKIRRAWAKLSDDQKEENRMNIPVPSSMKNTFDQYTTIDKVKMINAQRAGSVFNGSAVRSAGDFYIQLFKTMNCTIIFDDKVSAFINGDTFIREMLLNACQTNYKKRLVEYSAAETVSGRYEETPYALYVKSDEIYIPKVSLYTGKIMMLTNYDLSKDAALESRAQFFNYAPEKSEIANKIDLVIQRNIKESPQYENEFLRIEKFIKGYLGIDSGKLKNFEKYNHRIISKLFQLAIAHEDDTEFNHMATLEMKQLLGA